MARGSAGDGIGTTTIGFGDEFSEDLLTAMADAHDTHQYRGFVRQRGKGIPPS